MNGDDLSPTSRSLIDAARSEMSPDAAAASRVRAKVAAAIGAAAASSASGAQAASGSQVAGGAAGKLAGSIVVKLGLAVLVGGGIIAAVVATRGGGSAPRSLAPAVKISRPDVGRPDLGRPDLGRPDLGRLDPGQPDLGRPNSGHPDPGRPNSGQPDPGHPDPGHPDPGHPDPGHPDPGHPDPGHPDPGHPDPGYHRGSAQVSLAREVELIDTAMAALREGREADAITAVAQFDRETAGRGQLAEDAAAIELEATCRLHGDARAKLDAFDRRWPSSAQRARIAAACDGK